jgi:hypothetical protein
MFAFGPWGVMEIFSGKIKDFVENSPNIGKNI